MTLRTIRIVLLAALALPTTGQMEDAPYFSLTSNRTFGSGEKPVVSMTAWNVAALEFRVYRVNDPVKFFQQLAEPHQFGGRAPRQPGERTLLERIHGWKHSLRANIRRNLRGQFTESPSAHFEWLFHREPTAPAIRGTRYVGAPVLNSQQLVLSFVQPVRSANRWDMHTVPIGVDKKGLYLVEAVNGDLRAYTILMVSDLVMITKTARSRVLVYLADRATGAPVADAEVSVLTKTAPPGAVTTGKDGMAEIHVARDEGEGTRILARRGADIAAIAPYLGGIGREQWMGYLYTDRPVYRPGHTVHFKAILRLRAAVGYEVPAAHAVAVQVLDSDQKPVYKKTLTTNANGSVQDQFALPSTAALGDYYLSVKTGEGEISDSFAVQEYKKPEYEVRVTPAKPRVVQGESVPAVIEARYYFGEPVAGAKVKYSIHRSRYWYPLWYEPDEDNEAANAGGEESEWEPPSEQVAETEGQLDAEGRLTVAVPTTVSGHAFDYRYRIEARVTDEARREISGTGWLIATYGSFLVNVQPDRYFYAPATRATFTVQARDYDNRPVRTAARVELVRWNWRRPAASETKAAADVTTGANGSTAAALSIPAGGGSYRVRVTARTPEGRDVRGETWLWVAGEGDTDVWGSSARKTVQIVPDKKSYRPGDTAKLLIITGAAGTPVLVSIEGRDLRRSQLIRTEGATTVFEVPITADDEPSFFVSAECVREGEFYQGVKRVKVPPLSHTLDVKLATDKPQYLPGETATYRIAVFDSKGEPVPHAELSLGVVDEAIYAVRRESAQDILRFFYGDEWDSVQTESSLTYYFSGEAGRRRMQLAMLRAPSRLAQLKPERLVEPKVRKLFPDTAFWDAQLSTDMTGRASAKVPFPDSLTTWRATARGITRDTKAGSAVLKTIVRKNLILRLAVPRFFVQGDEVVVSAVVHNYLAAAKTARVTLNVTGLDVLEGSRKDVQVPSRGEAKVDWRVRARSVRSAKVSGAALTDEESDALELDLPVNPPGVKLAQVKGGSLAGGAADAFSLTFPERIEPGSRSLALRVSPSIAGALFSALDYLTSYPYGCVEQTMSSFLPNIIVKETVSSLGLKTNLDQAALEEKIRAGLDRLYTFQHPDGGWGWWETDESHPFMTAYVVAGLVQARAAGVEVRDDAIRNGAGWLERGPSQAAPDLRAYMAYALALAGRSAPAGQLYSTRSSLSPYGLALLGLALEQTKDARAAELATLVQQAAKQDEQQAWWPAARDPMLDFSGDATAEATAYAVKFLSHQRGGSPLLPKAALWLMNHRNEGYWWSSTKQTAMVIYGLTDYLKSTQELKPDMTATVYVNDQPVITRRFDASSAAESAELTLDESRLQSGENRIRVTGAGQGRLYYSARAEFYSTEERLQRTGSTSLNILRDYFRLAPGKQADRIVYDIVPLSGPAAAGDVIAVRLTVTGSEWKYLLVEDPIPAGTEFIERDKLYELKDRPPWWEYGFTRREMHDDRLAIFQTWFAPGQRQYFYLLKVVNPGMFQVSPARVQPMYQPDFLATTENRRLEVK